MAFEEVGHVTILNVLCLACDGARGLESKQKVHGRSQHWEHSWSAKRRAMPLQRVSFHAPYSWSLVDGFKDHLVHERSTGGHKVLSEIRVRMSWTASGIRMLQLVVPCAN